jgi:hypothetical protein
VKSKGLEPLPEAAERFDRGRKWAVVIGVNEYLDRDKIKSLNYCVRDAHLVAETLAARCSYDPRRILLITDDQPEAHLRPLKLNLQLRVQDWLLKARPDDTVLVFFSGHGFLDDRGQGVLAPQDCELDNLGLTGFRTDELRNMLLQCKATQKILVLDSCHSGAKGDEPRGPSSEEVGASFRLAEGLITLASCRKDETSCEWAEKRHGLFTYFLIEGLSGAADAEGDKNGLVDSDELYSYTLNQMSLVQRVSARQTPVRIIPEETVGRFLLARIVKPVEVSLASLVQGNALLKAGMYKEASDYFRKLTESNPGDARVWYFAAVSRGSATKDWVGETKRMVEKGIEREKAGSPDRAKIDAAFNDLFPTVKPWLEGYRKWARLR